MLRSRGCFLSVILGGLLLFCTGCKEDSDKMPKYTGSGVEITMPQNDYVNGYRLKDITPKTTADDVLYYVNLSSKTFHKPSCRYAQMLRDDNLYIADNLEEMLSAGYEPCGICNPE